jgi:two-component system CheB/CheR fusion protein
MKEKNRQKDKKKNQKIKNQSDNKKPVVTEPFPPEKDVTVSVPSFPIVGIGASAGGLAAFETFFSGMPVDKEPGMAFILVQHLAPNHKSMLAELISRCTSMKVFEVEDGMTVQVNCIYIIPPNHDMAFLNGTLQLLTPSMPRGQRLPIDFFFRSLAQDQRERSIAIVLSGTGSDGTLGVRAIKGEGGMVMAQTPETTEYDGMPRNAIATGLVDYILPPADMGQALESFITHTFRKVRPSEAFPSQKNENNLRKIFVLLRVQTGHDFSYYKQNTIMRRIERRMAVHQIDTIDEYVLFLQQTSNEIDALFRDLLIGVTNFFRDSDAFQSLEETIIPKLFSSNHAGRVIRVWSVGCSTGEEAYSIAILLQEYMETLKQRFTLQIFATDIDAQAISTARTGIYPASIAADISEERLTRFFTTESNSPESIPRFYRISKNIRDILIFSEQNVIKDPPFSKLDLICCRNLMIYLSGDLQKKLIPLFHYALNPGGFLFLGTSESVGEFTDIFASLNHKSKLYQRKNNIVNTKHIALSSFLPPLISHAETKSIETTAKKSVSSKVPLREIAEQTILKQLAPSSALVNDIGDIFYLHGRTGMFLEPDTGEVGNYNILKMAREGLRRELTIALQKVVQTQVVVRYYGLKVKTNDHFTSVNISICPVNVNSKVTLSSPLYLVMLEEGNQIETIQNPQDSLHEDAQNKEIVHGNIILALKQELAAKEEFLQFANEELETSNEELKSSNEEMQSMNEELQSTNEELETSKEELQSVNEELATVNVELQTKVTDLSRANNDMNNLLSGTGIATVFVDHQLRILRFTPTASLLINLIQGDVGRPINHIVSNLIGDDNLLADIQKVLDTLIPLVECS